MGSSESFHLFTSLNCIVLKSFLIIYFISIRAKLSLWPIWQLLGRLAHICISIASFNSHQSQARTVLCFGVMIFSCWGGGGVGGASKKFHKQCHHPFTHIVQFQKISILPPQKVFVLPPPPPPGNSGLSSYIASKILALKTPLPLGISSDLPWVRYGFFLELHIL